MKILNLMSRSDYDIMRFIYNLTGLLFLPPSITLHRPDTELVTGVTETLTAHVIIE